MKTAGILLSSLALLAVGAVAVLVLVLGGLKAVFDPDGGVVDRVREADCDRQPAEDHFCPGEPRPAQALVAR
ncbi:hypothetical protein K3N28_14800 [Glycomyces sp. TRM65418]|uniref:hypothetical protein n=1 Tax=Glycomyces sp. TRM65418 TaxID=2867006 RepID=UPI001CE4E9C5|nr:hypothetical protein [Glycomyces sp. TRM65418]MCC3764332.1 hypothetical protein [Glycomyces sp. TRM65418]QZD54011.1 hypothetical protein K3N28_14725 [Glycomyces sp. TRM65418]